MKAICVGGGLAGFASATHAKSPYSVKQMLEPGEPVVLVCHGAPYVMLPGATEPELPSEIRELNIHAVVLTHRAERASPKEVNDLKVDLGQQCQRIFGLTSGWDKLQPATRSRLLDFVTSTDAVPGDAEIQVLLAFDSPLARLTMRVALEIALRELENGFKLSSPGGQMDLAVLLAPALAIGEKDSSLIELTAPIKSGLSSGKDVLRESVSQGLVRLRS